MQFRIYNKRIKKYLRTDWNRFRYWLHQGQTGYAEKIFTSDSGKVYSEGVFSNEHAWRNLMPVLQDKDVVIKILREA